jgi:hypothetical protein
MAPRETVACTLELADWERANRVRVAAGVTWSQFLRGIILRYLDEVDPC